MRSLWSIGLAGIGGDTFIVTNQRFESRSLAIQIDLSFVFDAASVDSRQTLAASAAIPRRTSAGIQRGMSGR